KIHLQVEEVASGGKQRPKREELLKAARRREVDAIVVWKLDRWGRSLADLIASLAELRDLGIPFISLTEALDFTTSAGRAMVGLLSVFAEFERDMIRERVKAGIAQARAEGKKHGRPPTAATKVAEVKRLYKKGWNKSEIARELKISRGSVINLLK
ncbi:MAG: recombinase family protein, partial [Acidobacteriota bacterium]|nr:recombinase family protein [Acidobacteriota bacterium]